MVRIVCRARTTSPLLPFCSNGIGLPSGSAFQVASSTTPVTGRPARCWEVLGRGLGRRPEYAIHLERCVGGTPEGTLRLLDGFTGVAPADGGLASIGHLALLPRIADRCSLGRDRKSTRLNSSHVAISYAVFCLKKKKLML